MSVHSVLLFFTGMLPARGWWTAAEGQGINRGWDALCKGLSDIYSLPILPSTSTPENILDQQEGKHCASSKPWPLDLTSGVLVLTFCSDILRPSLLICLCCQLYNLLYNWTYFIQLDLLYSWTIYVSLGVFWEHSWLQHTSFPFSPFSLTGMSSKGQAQSMHSASLKFNELYF